MKRPFWIVVVAAAGVLFASVVPCTVRAQAAEIEGELEFGPPVPEPPHGFIERRTEAGFYRLAKRSIPLYKLVEAFLPHAAQTLTGNNRQLALEYSFGIEEGSREESALLRATLAAEQVVPDSEEIARRSQELSALRRREGDASTRRHNRAMMLEDARQVGVVWARLAVELGPGSSALVKIAANIEKRRESMSIVASESFEDPEHMLWRLERAFQAGIDSVVKGDPR